MVVPADLFAAGQPGVFVRVALLAPREVEWQVHIVAHQPGGKQADLFAGKDLAATADKAGWIRGQRSDWMDLTPLLGKGVPSVRFMFETRPTLEGKGVEARFEVSTAANEAAIVRSITDHDPGRVIALRVPADLAGGRKWLLSIREDTQRRLEEVKAMKLPEGPLPRRIWCLTGFRSNGQFYTDPAIARMDFDIIKMLGMNAYWEQNGGQPGELQKMAEARGIDRTTVYWRNVEGLPRDKDGIVRLDYDALAKHIGQVYRRDIENTRKAHPYGVPQAVVDLMDEPTGMAFGGPEYEEAFRRYCRENRLAADFFGKPSWDEVKPPRLNWWSYFKDRAALDARDLHARRLWYWAVRHWNYATARMYALATKAVQDSAGDVAVGTRVNFGPPWWYDYGTLPRGIDAFEFGKVQGVTLGFNEDWIGLGNPRIPLEIDTFLMDWSRAAARPAEPLIGCYITRDADRAAVKLRTFACLARNAKIFDFYYYGPSYTHFDPWSDNRAMAQGVGELLRDIGQVDELLWDGRPPRAEVALLYSKSWPVWKEDDTEQVEQMMTYVALLHAGIPVDIVSDEQVVEGWLDRGKYKVLYVVNESIPAAALATLEKWVEGGGRVWASGWAGMKDEYNTSTQAWNNMLGVKDRSWKTVGDTKRLGEVLKSDDWRRPAFAREVTMEPAAQAVGRIALARNYGKGVVTIVPRTAGKEYLDSATTAEGKLAKAATFPAGEKRDVFARFAADSAVTVPARTSVGQILAWPLWTKDKGVVLLANFSGKPVENMVVQFRAPMPVSKVRSLRTGEVKFTKDLREYALTLPMGEVTDVLVVE
jgi:hypothetical protein